MDYSDPERDALAALAAELDAAPHGTKSGLVAAAAARFGCSAQTLWKRVKGVGRDPQRKTRKDKGASAVTRDVAVLLSGMMRAGTRDNAKQALKLPTAVSILGSNGVAIDRSLSTVARALRRHRLDAASQARQTPHAELSSRHPNHVHMVDPSLCMLFYLKGKQHLIDEKEFYGNKLDAIANNPLKVWRYVMVDHFSAAITVRYYEAKGEDTKSLVDFLMYGWDQAAARSTYGVPTILMMDQGPGNKSHVVKNLCEGLEVQLLLHAPGNARAKGSVEVSNNIIETQFESRLRFEPVQTIAELNEAAGNWQQAFNANLVPQMDTRLRREGLAEPTARLDLYRLIQAHQIRLLPPLAQCTLLMHGKAEERRINGKLQFNYRHPNAARTQAYDLRGYQGVNRDDRVLVKPLAYGDCAVLVEVAGLNDEALRYKLTPISDYGVGGFRHQAIIGESFASAPKTDIERAGDEADRQAFGIDGDGVIRDYDAIQAAKAKKAKPFAHLNGGQGLRALSTLKGIAHAAELPKKGTPIVPDVKVDAPRGTYLQEQGYSLNVPDRISVPAVRLSLVEIARALMRELGDEWTPDKFAQLAEWYPAGCAEEELQGIADRMRRVSRMHIIKNAGKEANKREGKTVMGIKKVEFNWEGAPYMPINLKWVLQRAGIKQLVWCKAVLQMNGEPLSATAGDRIINWNIWPVKTKPHSIKKQTEDFLREQGVAEDEIAIVWNEDTADRGRDQHPAGVHEGQNKRAARNNAASIDMIKLEPQMLSQRACIAFGLEMDPFHKDVNTRKDVFITPDIRYACNAVYQTAKHGGMLAVIAESGAGKSVVRRDFQDRLQAERAPIRVILPVTLAKDKLTDSSICEAIIRQLAPGTKLRQTNEGRANQTQDILAESAKAGSMHVLVIEEAHDLTDKAIKLLKRFWELETGFKKLLSIVIFGQPELDVRLDSRANPSLREFINRCEKVSLPPLDGALEDYLKFKFARVGGNYLNVFEKDAFDAIREALTGKLRNGDKVSQVYALNVNNLVTKAMNECAELGAPKVRADALLAL